MNGLQKTKPWDSGRYDIDTDKILLHFNILPQQNIIFSQNPPITLKLQNKVLHGNMNMDASPKSSMLSAVHQIYRQVFHTPVGK